MKFRVERFCTAAVSFEISVDVDGSNYLVIYGSHINGGFCCIPNWNIGCEMSDPTDTFYNAEALMRCKLKKSAAKAIAAAIDCAAAAKGAAV